MQLGTMIGLRGDDPDKLAAHAARLEDAGVD